MLLTSAIKGIVPVDDYRGLATAEESYFDWLTNANEVEIGNLLIQAALFDDGADRIWGGTDDAGVNIKALATVPASRAEELWGESIQVSASQVGRAFNLI